MLCRIGELTNFARPSNLRDIDPKIFLKLTLKFFDEKLENFTVGCGCKELQKSGVIPYTLFSSNSLQTPQNGKKVIFLDLIFC